MKHFQVFDPHVGLKALADAFQNLETALSVVPMEDERKTIFVAKVNVGLSMARILDLIVEDDRDDAGEGRPAQEVEPATT